MDSSIRSAISSELSRLRKQEADVSAKIQAALQEENLAIEKKWKGSGGSGSQDSSSSSKGGRSAHALQKELDAVKEKIERHNASRKAVESTPGVKEARDKVVKCYKENPKRTLDCWKDVKSFSDAVEQAERVSCARERQMESAEKWETWQVLTTLHLQNFIASLK